MRNRNFSAKLARMNLLAPRIACKFSLLFALSAPVSLAAQAPAHFRSTDVHPDRSVTFSYKDAAATKVTLALDGVAKPIPMEKRCSRRLDLIGCGCGWRAARWGRWVAYRYHPAAHTGDLRLPF